MKLEVFEDAGSAIAQATAPTIAAVLGRYSSGHTPWVYQAQHEAK